jgi:hypothetical protein
LLFWTGRRNVWRILWLLQFNLLIVHHDINFIPVTNFMHKFLYSYNVTVLYIIWYIPTNALFYTIIY